MKSLLEVFDNYVLACGVAGWLAAQVLKFLIGLIRTRKFSFYLLISSGGMPSSHSSSTCALAFAVGRTQGFRSPLFAVAMMLAFIVMYDAAGVRRSAGEQAKLLNDLLRENGDENEKQLKEMIGHTPIQVLAGALIGAVIPFLFPVF